MNKKAKIVTITAILIIAILMMGFVYAGKAKKSRVKAQCNDRIDNDGDGYCDFAGRKTKCNDGSIPGDSDCSSKNDNKESADCVPSQEVCDGADNDCDVLIDEDLPIACSANSDCGQNGWTGDAFCGTDGNVVREWTSYACSNSATCSASCSGQSTDYILDYCSMGCIDAQCIGGNQSA